MENDRARQILGVIVGLIVVVGLILLAKWAGDRIREKFLTAKKPTVTTTQTADAPSQPLPLYVPNPSTPTTANNVTTPGSGSTTTPGVKGTSTVKTIPSTGPNDFGYVLLALMFFGGFALKLLDRKA